MQTVKKKIAFSKRKFREKVCSHRLLRADISPDHGYALYKWLCDMIVCMVITVLCLWEEILH